MIIIRLSQGLGNQLFQISLGLIFRNLYSFQDVLFDNTSIPYFLSNRKTLNKLHFLKNNLNYISIGKLASVTGKRLLYFKPLLDRIFRNNEFIFSKINYIIDKVIIKPKFLLINEPKDYWDIKNDFIDSLISFDFKEKDNYYLSGFFGSIRYIQDYRNLLIKELQFSDDLHTKFSYFLIKDNYVAIHFRRGDYLSISKKRVFNFNLCDDNYYKNSIKFMLKKIPNAFFHIFTDDPKFAKKYFSFLDNYNVIEGNSDFEDLYLLKNFSNLILANSTFGFWGAFLNDKPNKVVLCPFYHYIKYDNSIEYKVPFPKCEDWISIE
jgi:hypothetical protein